MLGVTDLSLFIAAGLLLNITPGADLLYISQCSAGQGRRAGVIAALGIGTGCLVHAFGAAFGLSMLLVSSSLAFTGVKIAGALYLIYLGVNSFLSLRTEGKQPERMTAGLSGVRIFRQAVLINVLNPKVALFFMAFLPQFVSPVAENPTLAFLFLGVVFNVNGTLVNILFALFTSLLASKVSSSVGFTRFLKSAVGALFVTLGIRLALTS